MDIDTLHDELKDLEADGVVLLRRDGETLYEGAFGLASRRWGVPNTMDTRFDTASITKLFTAVAVLQDRKSTRLNSSH